MMADEKCPECGHAMIIEDVVCGIEVAAPHIPGGPICVLRIEAKQLRAENENLRRAGTVMEQANTQFAAEFVASNATIAELRAENQRLRGEGEKTPRSFTMTTDETTPETNVTIGMLEELLSTANRIALRAKARGDAYKDRYSAAALATGLVLGEVRRLIPPRIPTPTPAPAPAPKYKEGDWVQHTSVTKVGLIVDVKVEPFGDGGRLEYCVAWEGSSAYWICGQHLLPIPPKPDKVQAGYRLRGDVKVADGSEPFIIAFGVNAGLVATCTVDMTVFGGRRWIVELDPVCPHCQDTHVCPHCKENAT